jgi:large subunit ribosomal protein L21
MYAIIEDGSHQFRVREGDRIRVDRRAGKPGDELVFSKVLILWDPGGQPTIGNPAVEGARVVGKIVNQFRAKKVIIQKFRRRKNVRRRKSHRQPFTVVQITSLAAPQSRMEDPSGSPSLPNPAN